MTSVFLLSAIDYRDNLHYNTMEYGCFPSKKQWETENKSCRTAGRIVVEEMHFNEWIKSAEADAGYNDDKEYDWFRQM